MWTMVMDLLGDLLEGLGSVGYFFWRLLRAITIVPCQFLLKLVRGGGDIAWNLFWISMVTQMLFRVLFAIASLIALYFGYQHFKPTIDRALGVSSGRPTRGGTP